MIVYVCETCGGEFIQKTTTQKTCSKGCRKVWRSKETLRLKPEKLHKMLSENRKRAVATMNATNAIKDSITKYMIQDYGHIYCEHEGYRSFPTKVEEHHIIFRSEAPRHPKKHSKENTLILCKKCHELYHTHKPMREKWIIERRLWEVFPEILKKERYE